MLDTEEERRLMRSRAEVIEEWGGPEASEKEARDRFYEANDAGVEMIFLPSGVAVWCPVGVVTGDRIVLSSLGRVELRYPFVASVLLDTVDALTALFESHIGKNDISAEEQHDLTERAKDGGSRSRLMFYIPQQKQIEPAR